MNKKALVQEKLMWIIIELILVGIFVTGSLFYISEVGGSSLYERLYLCRTFALRTSTHLAAPGELLTIYDNKEIENFKIKLENDLFELTEKEKNYFSLFHFPKSDKVRIQQKELDSPSLIQFEKQGGYLTINEQEQQFALKEKCITAESTATGLLLDPGHGGWDMGIVDGSFIEKNINREIARQIFRNSPYKAVKATRSVTQEEKVHIQRESDVQKYKQYALVSIHTKPGEEIVKTYINANSNTIQSRKLACKINNALVDVLPDLETALIIPINPDHIGKESDLYILSNVEIGVFVEISYPEIRTDIVGETLKKAIEQYKNEI